ncbi:hypothetical protein NPIL_363661 [Nephila pilipes]|uniref:Uncharacterized protein n=1 Tax=Nephila pilipes TaxID=299642 RepID=A0A8X6TGG9_NEPPI|nr:hypothetical protein NPIL_363661 [Nephila pilipes]
MVVSYRGLKSKLSVEKMHLNVITNYARPIAIVRYRTGGLYDGSKCLDFRFVPHKSTFHYSISGWNRKWYSFHRPPVDCPGNISRS